MEDVKEFDMEIKVGGRTRKLKAQIDGSYMYPRNNKELEDYMDENFVRVKNELRWFPKLSDEQLNITIFKNLHFDETCYVIGKGPSLDSLKSNHFKNDGPIIALNDSIHKVETLGLSNPTYVVQQDPANQEMCRPKKGILFLSHRCRGWYKDVEKKYIYSPGEFDLPGNALSMVVAIKLGQMFACKKFIFLAFDAHVNGNCEYAECLGRKSSAHGDIARYLKQKKRVSSYLSKLNTTFVIPEKEEEGTDVQKLVADLRAKTK